MATTLADLRLRVSSKIGLNNTAGSDEQLLIDSWVNEGILDMVIRGKMLAANTTFVLTPGTGDYSLASISTSIIGITEITGQSSGVIRVLERVDVEELLRMRIASVAATITRFYALQGNDTLMVFPTPQVSGDSLIIYYVSRPTLLATGTDTLPIPDEYHKAVEYYALAQAADYDNDAASQGGMKYLQFYEQELRKFKKAMWLKGGRKLARVIGGEQMRPVIPPRNDIDL